MRMPSNALKIDTSGIVNKRVPKLEAGVPVVILINLILLGVEAPGLRVNLEAT